MKGVWGGDKEVSKEHRPALDALATVDSELLRSFITAVVSTGAAVSISITRDAGAVVLTVLDGNQRHKLYPSDQHELRQALVDGIESFSPSQTPPNTAPKGKR